MEQAERCGWFCYTPIYFQRFNSVSWVILFLSLGALMQGTIVNGLLHYVIVTIERRFNLRSSESGLVSGGYDIASLIFLIPITFFGGRPRSHKPKWIGLGLIIIGTGSFIFCLPYFLAPKRNIVNDHAIEILCNQTSRTLNLEKDNLKDSQLSGYKWILLLGNFLHGLGAVPLFTLAVTYIDGNVPRKKSSLCLGLFYSAATLGPALGYILGGNLLQLHEDFWKKDSLGSMITPENKAWIGAWWFGFIICGIIIFIVAIPVLGLPSKLPDWKEIERSRVSEAVIVVNRTKAYEHFHELPKAMFELLRNSSFVFINLAGCCEGIIISGSGTFIPKIIQVQFHLTSKTVAYVMGMVAVPSAVMGILMGGGIIKRYDLKFNGILKLCICSTILAMLSSSGFFFTCSSEKFAGVNVPYFNETTLSLNHPCNEQCKCEYNDFSPTCGINNLLYFSPCYAGCTTSSLVADNIMVSYANALP
uniref:Solute carrier organic anion transporter family member n=1 Tax=Clastoptera arizonana TaxID=38151 RepID=A0A1B6EGM8_9HEMI